MTQFTKDNVQYFANFARIAISDAEAETLASKIGEMIEFTNDLRDVDTENVQPMTHPVPMVNVLREDTPVDVLDREEMLVSVEEHEDGMIKVPNIL